jgi:hypothetical protein
MARDYLRSFVLRSARDIFDDSANVTKEEEKNRGPKPDPHMAALEMHIGEPTIEYDLGDGLSMGEPVIEPIPQRRGRR